jgi:hypothetical protein
MWSIEKYFILYFNFAVRIKIDKIVKNLNDDYSYYLNDDHSFQSQIFELSRMWLILLTVT